MKLRSWLVALALASAILYLLLPPSIRRECRPMARVQPTPHSKPVDASGATLVEGMWPIIGWPNYGSSAHRSFSDPGLLTISTVEIVPDNFAEAPIQFDENVTPGTYRSELPVASAFSVDFVSPRHGNELYVAGHPISPGGDLMTAITMIEEWKIQAPAGAPFTERPRSTTPLGMPAPHSQITIGVQGGEYKLPGDRATAKVTRRFIATISHSITGMAVDPEGRYILLMAPTDGGIFQIDLVGQDPGPYLVASSSQFPALASAEGLQLGRFGDGAKKYVVWCSDASTQHVILADAENDGLFETVEELTAQEYADAGYLSPSSWIDNYGYYRLPGFF